MVSLQREAVEKAIVVSASNVENDRLMAETRIKDAERDVSPDYESDDELRRGNRIVISQGVSTVDDDP